MTAVPRALGIASVVASLCLGCARSGDWTLSTYRTSVARYELSDRVVGPDALAALAASGVTIPLLIYSIDSPFVFSPEAEYRPGVYIPNLGYPDWMISKPPAWQSLRGIGLVDTTLGQPGQYVYVLGGVSGVWVEK